MFIKSLQTQSMCYILGIYDFIASTSATEKTMLELNNNNLAFVYARQGEYKKAEELYKKALGISERILGEEHPDTATSYNNLAGVYTRQEEYKKALRYYLKSYNILLLKLGQNHPYTQQVYENVQWVYSKWNPEGDFGQWLEENIKNNITY